MKARADTICGEEAAFMRRALSCARRGEGRTRPNPPVGAVVVKDGRVIGEGWHKRCGGDHAEVAALKCAARRAGADAARGASVYVTLEPCSRPGRVGACCDALIAAGVARVAWAIPDPNPKNCGGAARKLRSAGIETECWCGAAARGDCAKKAAVEEALSLIAPFAKHVATGLPYVTVKLAMSLDGRICDEAGESKWISSAAARRETGRYRSRADVVLVGAETIRRDNPSLLCHGKRNDSLWRAIVSSSGRLPKDAQVFTDAAAARTLVYSDPREAMADLGRRGFLHVFCEGGLGLARSLADAGLVDQWITVLSPIVIGSSALSKALRLGAADCSFPHPGGDVMARFARDVIV